MASPREEVAQWIEDNFDPGAVTITDFPAFPYGKLLTDRKGETMVVYYDIVVGMVTYTFPDGDPSNRT
jgi:hypothetical protein